MSSPMGFNKAITIIKQTPSPVNITGFYSVPANTVIQTTAGVQPTSGQDIQNLPEGKKDSNSITIRTTHRLLDINDLVNYAADGINSVQFEVVSMRDWQSSILPHYKYYAVKKDIEVTI